MPLVLALVAALAFWGWRQLPATREPAAVPLPADERTAPNPTLETPEPRALPDARLVQPQRATPVGGSLLSLFSSDDYPMAAIRREEQGTVVVELTIGRDGRVRACGIATSSGSTALDRASCGIFTRRARFIPARNERGAPIEDRYPQRIRWVLPDE